MDAEFQRFVLWFLQVLIGAFSAILWMNFRDLKFISEATTKELAAYKLHVAECYVTQNDLSKAIDSLGRSLDAVFKKLDRIEEKLDNKQDK